MACLDKSIILKPTGDRMPLIGLGTAQIPEDKCPDIVYYALKNGYRLLDAAMIYLNEKEVGDGIKKAIDDGIVKREDIFITSKLWDTYHKREHVRPALEKTLSDLQVEYLDLYLVHFPISVEYIDPKELNDDNYGPDLVVNVPIRETWEAMEELVDAGLVRNIGFSNFNAASIMDLLKYARIKPSVLQIEHHPYLTQEQLINYVKSQQIAVTAFSSFGSHAYKTFSEEIFGNAPDLLKDPTLVQIGEKHNKSAAQVILRWAIQRDIAVIPKSSNENRIIENSNILDFTLSDEEMKEISSLNRNLRYNEPGLLWGFPVFA